MSPARPIRLGIAGLGRAFSLMLPTFLDDRRIRMVAACDPRDGARARFADDFGAPVHADIEGLVRDPAVEAVYIASPHQFHAEHVRIAAAGGKHVLVEKPMALTIADCDAMIEACATAGVALVVGHCHSFDTPYLAAREFIAGGEFGDVKMIHALNYTDYLYRPRRPEELDTEQGGGAVFSQAAHQVDIVRLLAGSPARRVRAVLGAWDPARPIEGAYAALLWFDGGAFASITYSGYGHFDSDEWCGWTAELGASKNPDDYGAARRRLAAIASGEDEAGLKAAGTYGGKNYKPIARGVTTAMHNHFGPVIVSCERGDVRPTPDALWLYGDSVRERRVLAHPPLPRFEVIDELHAAINTGRPALHDGIWARSTLEICLALIASAREQRDIEIGR